MMDKESFLKCNSKIHFSINTGDQTIPARKIVLVFLLKRKVVSFCAIINGRQEFGDKNEFYRDDYFLKI
jgi:hypothetical protein